MIVDVQDAQEDVLSWLLGGIEAKSYKFTDLMPLVVPESNYILRGDTLPCRCVVGGLRRLPMQATFLSTATSGTDVIQPCWPKRHGRA